MRACSLRVTAIANRIIMLALVALLSAGAVFAQAQATAADLVGTVADPTGAIVPGATVTARNAATGITRTTTSSESGEYQILGLPPGSYEVTAEAANFKKTVISSITLTIGQRAELPVKLELGEQTTTVTIDGSQIELVETTRTAVATTIDQKRIENLPINERSATGFALTISTVGRDNGRPIGPAPTSGLNIGGQRGRSTLLQVDGADFTDNSVNAARSTVSQEAVQEYQVATNSYLPEFGRATGGVVNVVTKRGTNDFHGNVFGYFRDKSIQARNAFAPVDKPDFRRTQYGATLGGPLATDRTFFFFSWEGRRRDESGFFTSNVAQGLTSSVTVGAPFLPFSQTFNNLTPQQAAYAQTLLGNAATASLGIQYLTLASSGSNTALTGTNPLRSPGGTIGAGQVIGQRFFLTGAPVPVSANAFRPLNDLQRVFPITDRTNFYSIRGDHNINDNNQFFIRFGYNPSTVTGIQVESQNQSLGQNDFSRTGIAKITDASFSTGLNSTLSGTLANEFRFNFGKRKTSFVSQNGEAVAYNIAGAAFIGRELFSPVDRQENRFQLADNINWVAGNHTMKFGADFNWVTIPQARFELNFAGLFNFGNLGASDLMCSGLTGAQLVGCQTTLASAPDFTPVQTYGLGLPSNFIQGFGNPFSQINNKPIAFFAQDTWKIFKNFTLNYGVRYDVELTDTIAPVGFTDPLSGIALSANDILAAQDAVGVQQGLPRDTNNFAPRLAFAWDIFSDQKTVLRGAIGTFYDHPLLAVAFNSDIADDAQQQQAILTAAGGPSPTALLNATQVFQGTVCGPGFANPVCPAGARTPGLAPTAQYQFGRQRFNDQTFIGYSSVLPFSLPIAKDFQYASATQANLAIERQITKDMSLSVSYLFVGAHHLPHPTDLNPQNTTLLIQNFQRFANIAPPTRNAALAGVSIPTTTALGAPIAPGTPFTNNFGVTCAVVIPGMVAQCPNGRVVAPAIANFFRPNSPNYFLAQALSGGAVTKAVLDSQLTGSLRTPGLVSPFGSVNAQVSDGNSSYNAMNVELKRRFANNFQFLATYTWSHSIDDSSDLQTLLVPQDVRNFRAEKANSLFDQRHRFVFSGVMTSPTSWRGGNGFQKFLADFTVAPIIEVSSGRPFNIITNFDANVDQTGQTDRPSVNADGSLCIPGTTGCSAPLITNGQFTAGNLGRNAGLTRNYFAVDLGITRAIRFNERVRLDLIAQGFNLFNRFNEAAVSPLFSDVNAFGQRAKNGAYYSRSTAAYDPRQFQFGVKLNF